MSEHGIACGCEECITSPLDAEIERLRNIIRALVAANDTVDGAVYTVETRLGWSEAELLRRILTGA